VARNLLIVDDSATTRRIILRGLRQGGCQDTAFEATGGGVEGLGAAEGGAFDLILSDVDAPDINRLDFVKAVAPRVPTPPPSR